MELNTNNTTSNIKVLTGNGKATSKYVTNILKPYIKEGKNILLQSDINKENTKYIIKYNFDLDGKEITIPNNCIIEFDGGSFSDGTIIFNDTYLTFYGDIEEVLIDVEIKGNYVENVSEVANSLADKTNNTDGMGKIYLKKNKAIQEQMTQPNTIYVVQYNFDLGGKELNVPDGCILDFDGGSLKNGSVVGNNTAIRADLVQIFDVNVEISGSWNVTASYPDWFGTANDGKDNIRITKASYIGTTTYLIRDYYFDYDSTPYSTVNIVGKSNFIGIGQSTIYVNAKRANTEKYSVIEWQHRKNVYVENIHIEYTNYDYSEWTGIQAGVLRSHNTKGSLTVKSCSVKYGMGAFINIFGQDTTNITFNDNLSIDNDCGIIIQGTSNIDNLIIRNNYFYKPTLFKSEWISVWGDDTYKNIYIENNLFEKPKKNKDGGGTIYINSGAESVTIRGNVYKNCTYRTIRNAKEVTLSEEKVVETSFFDNMVSQRGGVRIYNVENAIIDNCVLEQLDINYSVVVCNNITFCSFIEDTFSDVNNMLYNHPFITTDNSICTFKNCNFIQSLEHIVYTDLIIRIISDNNSQTKMIDCCFDNCGYFDDRDLKNLTEYISSGLAKKHYKFGKEILEGKVVDDINNAKIGDYVLQETTLSKIDSYTQRKYCKITLSEPINKGTVTINMDKSILKIKVAPQIKSFTTPATIVDTVRRYLINNSYDVRVGSGYVVFLPPFLGTKENISFDFGDTGIKGELSIINN